MEDLCEIVKIMELQRAGAFATGAGLENYAALTKASLVEDVRSRVEYGEKIYAAAPAMAAEYSAYCASIARADDCEMRAAAEPCDS